MSFLSSFSWDPFAYLDQYCERLAPGLLMEPFNLVSNLPFVLVGIWQFNRSRRRTEKLLGILSGLVGLGSMLFHSFATSWSQALDVIPIVVLIFTFLFYYQVRILKWSNWKAALGLLFVVGSSAFSVTFLKDPVYNGSQAYFGVTLGLAVLAYKERHEVRGWLFLSLILFLISLVARIFDPIVCAQFVVGSHFIWHLLNAASIMCAFRSLRIPHMNYLPKSNKQIKNILVHVPKEDLSFLSRTHSRKSKRKKSAIKRFDHKK
jgi:hypothetical protein